MSAGPFEPVGLSKKIFVDRYALTPEETWSEACLRIAKQMALAEPAAKQKQYEEAFNEVLVNNMFVPGGRIWYNSGRNNPQLLNCFVLTNQLDSKEGWGEIARQMIVTSMTGGGCGIDFSDVRPRGSRIGDQKGDCPGPVELMRLIDNCAKPVRAGGQRRVALMFSLDLDHPDVEEFLDAKLVKGELTHANVSVRVKRMDDFVRAVKEDDEWNLAWKGKAYKTIKAKDLWAKIVKNAYNSAEPGVLNWELASNESNIWYEEGLVTTNPSLRKGTKVVTSEGVFPIEQLQDKEILVKNLNGKISKAKCFLSGKGKQLYRIKLSTGFEYYCTPEHKWPIMTSNGPRKVETTEIKPGDALPVLKQDGIFEGSVGTREDGFIVGWLYGDGWITERSDNGKIQYGFIVGKKDQEFGIHKKISSYLSSVSGEEYEGSARDGCVEFSTANKKIHEHFLKLGVTHKSKGIPDLIWRDGSEEFRKGFIDGLFSSDGHAGTPLLKRLVLVSKHDQLVSDISELLGFYGIKTRLKKTEASSSFPNKKDYGKKYKRNDLVIDNRCDLEHFNKLFNLSRQDKQSRLESYSWSRAGLQDAVEIKEIELTDLKEDVWDISVYDDTHCFQLSHCITGNCGEIALSSYDCCCLGHLVLPRFVSGDDLDWNLLGNTIRTGVRFLDNVLSVNYYPLPEMKEKSHRLRRIGLGTTGLADTLALLGYKYGSQEGLKFIDKLYKFVAKAAYEASIMLAVEKDPFPACNPEKHLQSGFMKRMPAKIRSLVKEHGIRNCAILTQAPTGTVSMLSGNCSSGIEPMFSAAYERRWWVDNVRHTELVFHPLFEQFVTEGRSTAHFVGSHELAVRDHMEVQAAVQKWVDNAVSKTINMANDYPIEDMEALWLEFLPKLKGTTFYRDGTRGYVAEDGTVGEPPLKHLDMSEALKRFKELHKVEAEAVDDCPNGVCEF